MKIIISAVMAAVVACLIVAMPANADTDNLQTLARITMTLNHYPSDAEKATLKAIVDSDDSSEEEASIAMALYNMQHKVKEKDAERLMDIVDDETSNPVAKDIASILLEVNHSPNDADKAKLAALASN
ncbi:MAG: hypothetical protein KJO31_12020 [Gammaproteobacteria bacterium]|nr:hypothetical protein [Gammaproteobacteria bacterium]